ncbi:MAG: serine/threonine-protein phosphatase [Paraburkholderia sp.]|nr:MAG: serine/threonine-protein phosphatase [Paraburkholderia sp.]
MHVSCAHFSCAGARRSNQDVVGYRIDAERACFVVSDGIGGMPGGGVAAERAVAAIIAHWSEADTFSRETARACVQAASEAIAAGQRHDPTHANMSTTVVALFIDRLHGRAQWLHVGDSRLYRFRHGALAERTSDHSVTQRMRDAGLAVDGVNPSLLHRALGMHGPLSTSDSDILPLVDGDAFILCTDGFWQLVSERTLERTLRIVHSADDWARLLEHEASRHARIAPRADNYSAVVVWIGHPEHATLVALA